MRGIFRKYQNNTGGNDKCCDEKLTYESNRFREGFNSQYYFPELGCRVLVTDTVKQLTKKWAIKLKIVFLFVRFIFLSSSAVRKQ